MKFSELVNVLEHAEKQCDLEIAKASLFAEASYKNYLINCEEAELKVIKESGNTDDLMYLYEEAKEGLIDKAKNAVKKIFDALMNFAKSIAEKIKSFFTSKSTKDSIDKIEDACKKNPKLKNKKIESPDYEKAEKECDSAINKIKKVIAKIGSGHVSEHDNDTLDEVAATDGKVKKILAGGAVVSVTIAAAIGTLRALYKKGNEDYIKGDKTIFEAIYKNLSTAKRNLSTPGEANINTKCSSLYAAISKIKHKVFADRIKHLFSAIASIFRNAKKEAYWYDVNDNVIGKESAFDADSYLDSMFSESTNDIDSIFDSILESVDSSSNSDDDIFDSLLF